VTVTFQLHGNRVTEILDGRFGFSGPQLTIIGTYSASMSNFQELWEPCYYFPHRRGLVMFWDMTAFCMKSLKVEWEVNQQEVGDEFKRYMIWQMIRAMLH